MTEETKQPEALRDTENCDVDVFQNGYFVGMFPHLSKEEAESLCIELTSQTGRKHDWHYFGGRPRILAVAPNAARIAELESENRILSADLNAAKADIQITKDRHAQELEAIGAGGVQPLRAEPVSGADVFPAGFIVVPLNPTRAMQEAWDRAPSNEDSDTEWRGAYGAMLAAAPNHLQPSGNSGELPEDDSIALDRLADYIADTWPMDKKYGLEEICQRIHAMWPGEFIAIEDLRKNEPNLREAVRALLTHWQRFQKSDGNQQDAAELLVKGARKAWQFAEDELARSEPPAAQAQPPVIQPVDERAAIAQEGGK